MTRTCKNCGGPLVTLKGRPLPVCAVNCELCGPGSRTRARMAGQQTIGERLPEELRKGRSAVKTLARVMGETERSVYEALKKLEEAGTVRDIGVGRAGKWVLA